MLLNAVGGARPSEVQSLVGEAAQRRAARERQELELPMERAEPRGGAT